MKLILVLLLSIVPSQYLRAAEKNCQAEPFAIRDGSFEVAFTRYTSALGTDRLVIVLPPSGGTNFIDRSYAQGLCQAKLSALVIDSWSDDQEYSLEIAIHDRFYRRGQRAIDAVIAHAPERRIALLGTSVGAEHAAIATRRNPRIEATFLIVGGAPIASILATSDQEILADGKEKRFKLFGYRSLKEYEAALEAAVPFEPLKMAAPFREPKLGMSISLADTTVPTEFQLRLKEAWRPMVVLFSPFGHMGTIVKTWLCDQSRVVEFFTEALS